MAMLYSIPCLTSRWFNLVTLTGLLLLSPVLVQADDANINAMLEIIDQRLGNETAWQLAVEDGEQRALICKYCHGGDGNSLNPEVPNLAGQNARYLLEQINRFATKERNDDVMSELAAGFSAEDKINVAIFYHSQPVKPQSVDDEMAAKGKILYESVCSICHGIEGYGNEKLARVAGQQVTYTVNVMKAFRTNALNPADRKKSLRKSEVMEGVVRDLTDEQIEAVAAYMSQMQ